MPKIYLYTRRAVGWASNDVIGYALAEDGHVLASHLSSGVGFAKHDLGLTSTWKHEYYNKHYPDGYELEWVDDPSDHAGVRAALSLNKQLWEAEQAAKGVVTP